jgi:hypothetical protein
MDNRITPAEIPEDSKFTGWTAAQPTATARSTTSA